MPSALILVENNSAPADTRVRAICRSLRGAGWDVSVISPTGQKRDPEHDVTIDDIRYRRFDLVESAGGGLGYIREYGSAFVRIRALVRELSANARFDVVHACNPPDFLLLAARSLRSHGAATVFDHHDLSPELYAAKYRTRFPVEQILRLGERVGFSLADVTLASNDSFRNIAIERGKKSPQDVFLVRNGPDPTVFKPREGDSGLRQGAAYLIGYVGLMGSQDGADIALEALAALQSRRDDWRAVFVGDGDAMPTVRKRAAELGIDDRVLFTGYIQDAARVVEIIASCDVCLSPEPRNRLNESSTFVKVAEYMAVGRPVVAFDLYETRKTAGDAATYAVSDDAQAFADAIDDLLNDESKRQRLGALGRERVLAQLGWEHSERALLAAYDRAMVRAGMRHRQGRLVSPAATPAGEGERTRI